MQRLWLDYVQPPPGRQWPGWVVLLSGIAATAWLIAMHLSLQEEIDRLDDRVTKLRLQSNQAQALQQDTKRPGVLPESIMRALISQSGPAWENRFAALEAATDDSVTLLALTPEKDGLTLNGEAQNLVAARYYVDRLQSTPTLTDVQLVEYVLAKDHPRRPIRFTVTAHLRKQSP